MGRDYLIEMEELDAPACWRLLRRELLGRVGFVGSDGEITVLPVNAGVIGSRIVVRTSVGSALATVDRDAPVAFEVDHAEVLGESGWSVLVRGHLHDVTAEAAKWSDSSIRPWAPGPHDCWLAIEPSKVTGKRISRRRIIDRTVCPDERNP